MVHAGTSRRWIVRRLNAAYADGLLSQETFVWRLDRALRSRVLDPGALVGDLTLRGHAGAPAVFGDRLIGWLLSAWAWVAGTWAPAGELRSRAAGPEEPPSVFLALDWSGQTGELLLGRDDGCDVVLSDGTVSRNHARLVYRDAKWIVQDLHSTNGTSVNGTAVGRCELRPGDRLVLGETQFLID